MDDAIDELEEIVEEFDLSEHDWSSVDDASDYLFEHKVKDEEEFLLLNKDATKDSNNE